jgi:hypothetical protein
MSTLIIIIIIIIMQHTTAPLRVPACRRQPHSSRVQDAPPGGGILACYEHQTGGGIATVSARCGKASHSGLCSSVRPPAARPHTAASYGPWVLGEAAAGPSAANQLPCCLLHTTPTP